MRPLGNSRRAFNISVDLRTVIDLLRANVVGVKSLTSTSTGIGHVKDRGTLEAPG